MTTVRLDSPRVEGDTVWFTWDDDSDLPPPLDGGLFYRFEGIELSAFSETLWLEIFLALRLRAYTFESGPVRIVLPSPVPAAVASFWRTYHDADSVTIEPITADESYSPWKSGPSHPAQKYDWVVFLGGGRDSLATAALLGEMYGRERVLLLNCVDPPTGGEERRSRYAEMFAHRSFTPLEEQFRFGTQRVWTNLHALALGEGGKRAEPHLEQYTMAMLPVALAYGIPHSTFCSSWFEYIIFDRETGPHFNRARSRPEILAAQTFHVQRSLGVKHSLHNVNLLLTGNNGVRLLVQRYPELFPYMTMCIQGSPNQRWCGRCAKCGRYAWHLLAEQIEDDRFDLNRVLLSNDWMRSVIEELKRTEGLPNETGNFPWSPSFWNPMNSIGLGDLFARTDLAAARKRLWQSSWSNVHLVKSMLGNFYQPMYDTTPEASFQMLPADTASRLRPVIETITEIVPEQTDQLFTGLGPAWGPFAKPFHHPLLELPHLQ